MPLLHMLLGNNMSAQHPTNSAFYHAQPVAQDHGILVCRVFDNDHMIENINLQLPVSVMQQIASGVIKDVPITANNGVLPSQTFRFNILIPGQTAKLRIDRVHVNWGNATQDLTDASREHQNPTKRRFGFILCDCSFI